MHCKVSGVTDQIAMDDQHALMLAREAISKLNLPSTRGNDVSSRWDYLTSKGGQLGLKSSVEEPIYDPSELYGIVGSSLTKNFDIREIIARIVDGSRFNEFKKMYGESLVCGFANIYGINNLKFITYNFCSFLN